MPVTPPLKILISMHDATPFHLSRLRKAEAFFLELGLEKVTYLFIPEYHGSHLASSSPEFIDWCNSPRPFQVQWHLHGYQHLETTVHSENLQKGTFAKQVLQRTFMTAGEGEFLALDTPAIAKKLEHGRQVFRSCLQVDPLGFVAPAWLFNSNLPAALLQQGIRYTENHHTLFDLVSGGTLPSPVITWATRSLLRKYGSLLVCPIQAKLWRSTPVLRVAMHPFDFDHSATVASIRSVLTGLLQSRDQIFCDALKY